MSERTIDRIHIHPCNKCYFNSLECDIDSLEEESSLTKAQIERRIAKALPGGISRSTLRETPGGVKILFVHIDCREFKKNITIDSALAKKFGRKK